MQGDFLKLKLSVKTIICILTVALVAMQVPQGANCDSCLSKGTCVCFFYITQQYLVPLNTCLLIVVAT